MRILPVFLLFASLLFSATGVAQQVHCSLTVNMEAVATTNRDLLVNFESDVRDYLNGYSWGQDNLDEKIQYTMTIFFKGATGDKYVAQAFIGSQRSILNSEKASAVVRLLDETWEFTYVKTNPINHTPYTFNDLASFLDFYAYLIIGHDYDTYEEFSGTPFFQKAADIANLGRSSGSKGWQAVTSGYSRSQYVEEMLNPKYAPLRSASYRYHFRGLDSLSSSPTTAYANILEALDAIGKLRKNSDPRNLVIKSFFDTKYLEIADVFTSYPDPNIYKTFSYIDPSHQTTYEDYRARRK